MLTQASLTEQLSIALGSKNDSLIPQLARVLADEIIPLQRELQSHVRSPGSDGFNRAAEELGAKIDEIERTFKDQLEGGELYELLRRSRESVAENGGEERQEMLRKIAAEYAAKPPASD